MPSAASDFGTLKCGVNEDRVWVYDSLATFDVEAKLPCGASVEILSRVKGYVKIRTTTGMEGYVPDSTFPDLPPLEDNESKLGAHDAVPVAVAATAIPRTEKAAQPPVKKAEVAAVPVKRLVAAPPTPPAPPAPAAPQPKSVPQTAKVVEATHLSAPNAQSTATRANSIAVLPVSEPVPPPQPASILASVPDASPSRPVEVVAVKRAAPTPESEDYPDTQPENESADPACRVYFSAYGLGATQYKWFAESRRKQYASICPAPNLASVDFVILFTHDSDSYSSALPGPVHVDRNGFSDFNPLTPVDPALMSLADADKARYALAWVFHVKRGTFDPGDFSPRRRPQFSTVLKGSRASVRAVEDAFSFIEQQPTGR